MGYLFETETKDALGFSSMFFDGYRFLMIQHFTNVMDPTQSESHNGEYSAKPFEVGNEGGFEIETTRFETTENEWLLINFVLPSGG